MPGSPEPANLTAAERARVAELLRNDTAP
jgi:hypothetical protein